MIRFKSKKKFIILAMLLVILAGGLIVNYAFSPSSYPTFAPIVQHNELTQEDFMEDFEFAYETLKTHYPYFDVNKKVHNIDWLGNKEKYLEMVSQCKTHEEFYEIMHNVLNDLNNGHTQLVSTGYGPHLYISYKSGPRFDWRADMAKIYEKPRVQGRYRITNKSIERILEAQANYEPGEMNPSNVVTGDIIPEKAGYISIAQMVKPDLNMPSFKAESDDIKAYLEKIKEYPILIIDIRRNGGGYTRYWTNFLMPLIVDETYSQQTYRFVKDGALFNKFKRQSGFKNSTHKALSGLDFPEETLNMINDFSYFGSSMTKVVPHKDSINFKGKIYLLVDKGVYSSSEQLASFAKESKMATLVGERTGGDGIGTDPMLVDLPNTGYVLRFSKEMGVTEKGSINELDQTEPDILISNPIKEINFGPNGEVILNDDKAITAIIEKEGM